MNSLPLPERRDAGPRNLVFTFQLSTVLLQSIFETQQANIPPSSRTIVETSQNSPSSFVSVAITVAIFTASKTEMRLVTLVRRRGLGRPSLLAPPSLLHHNFNLEVETEAKEERYTGSQLR